MNNAIFQDLNHLALFDFEVVSLESANALDGTTLTIRGSRDFTYYHNAEIRFLAVEYMEIPTRFSHAQFRVASPNEVTFLRGRVDFEGAVFCVIEEHGSNDERVRYVVASSVAVDLNTVSYSAEPSGSVPR